MIQWQYVCTYEIKNIIKPLKSKNTCGYNEISNWVLKLSSQLIISPLTYICNAVFPTYFLSYIKTDLCFLVKKFLV